MLDPPATDPLNSKQSLSMRDPVSFMRDIVSAVVVISVASFVDSHPLGLVCEGSLYLQSEGFRS